MFPCMSLEFAFARCTSQINTVKIVFFLDFSTFCCMHIKLVHKTQNLARDFMFFDLNYMSVTINSLSKDYIHAIFMKKKLSESDTLSIKLIEL